MSYLLSLLGTPHSHAVCFTLVSAAAVQALIAIWAATSRRHWFWRALAVWAAVMALAPIRAYEPAIVFAVSSPLTAALIQGIQQGQRWKRRDSASEGKTESHQLLRFGLRDIFLLMALVGLSLAGILHLQPNLPRFDVPTYTVAVAALVTISVTAWVWTQTQGRTLFSLLLIAIVAVFSFAITCLGNGLGYYDIWSLLGVGFIPTPLSTASGTIIAATLWSDVRIVAMAMTELALLLVGFLALANGRPRAEQSRFARIVRGAMIMLTAAIVIFLAAVYWQILSLAPLPPRFSNATTHYHRLLEIADRITSLNIAMPAATTPSAIEQQERTALIAEVVILVESANFVPFDPSIKLPLEHWDNHPEGRLFMKLAQSMADEASAAVSRGDMNEASELALATMRLGVMLNRGGLIPDLIAGNKIENLAFQRLTEMRGDLSPEKMRAVLTGLQRAMAEHEDIASIVAREGAVEERTFGWGIRFENVVSRLTGTQPDYLWFHDESVRRRTAENHLLQADLTLHLFHQDRDSFPKNLEELVPAYLPEMPPDPYSNQPLLYRPEGDRFTLYSVGHDRVDNGGHFTNSNTYFHYQHGYPRGYDFDLDTLTRP